MILVTGAAGFIGNNIVRAINRQDAAPVFGVDHLSNDKKKVNLSGVIVDDYLDKEAFLRSLDSGAFRGKFSGVFHQGACTDTLEQDSRYLLSNNFRYSRSLLEFSQRERIPFIYASSAAVYGASTSFSEERINEKPLNKYGRSKLLFDLHVRRVLAKAQGKPPAPIVGLRYFNVYGPSEDHKGHMASVVFHMHRQYADSGAVALFGAHDGYLGGEQQRDFIHVDDVVAVNRFFFNDCSRSGIFNVGTGTAHTFNDVAVATIHALEPDMAACSLAQLVASRILRYIAFPDAFKASYQSRTQADIVRLREAGYAAPFIDVAAGVTSYLAALEGR